MKLTAIVVDDEPLARRKLQALIADTPDIDQVGEAGDGVSALELIEQVRPDIVFLDIEMPVLSGIGVVSQLKSSMNPPVVIFTTGYDHYAVTAFELEAVDYLLKPFGVTRFQAALVRARHLIEVRAAPGILERAKSALGTRGKLTLNDRIFAKRREGIVPIQVSAIRRIHAQDDYVMIHADEREFLVSLRISDLEANLPNPPFLRVHRSHIVNLDFVERIVSLEGAHLEVRMKSGTRVPVSRVKSQEIRQFTI